MNFELILIMLAVLTIIILLTYFLIIKRFNIFIIDHRKKIDQYILKAEIICTNTDNDVVKDD